MTYTYQVHAVVSETEQTDLCLPASATPAGLVTNLTAVEASTGILLNWNTPGPLPVICATYPFTGTKAGRKVGCLRLEEEWRPRSGGGPVNLFRDTGLVFLGQVVLESKVVKGVGR